MPRILFVIVLCNSKQWVILLQAMGVTPRGSFGRFCQPKGSVTGRRGLHLIHDVRDCAASAIGRHWAVIYKGLVWTAVRDFSLLQRSKDREVAEAAVHPWIMSCLHRWSNLSAR